MNGSCANNKSISAFTLIELSIVLIIIGLVAGGVLMGRDLVRFAELRKLNKQVERFSIAVHTFKEKYQCLPGDCLEATKFFGVDPEGCNDAFVVRTPKVETCNGNGNGMIELNAATLHYETFLFWQHLASAQLITGLYSGGETVRINPIINCPAVSLREDMCFLFRGSPSAAFAGSWSLYSLGEPGETNLMIMYPSGDLGDAGIWGNPKNWHVLSGAESYQYDIKFDDGDPVRGKIRAINSGFVGTNCTTTDDPSAEYKSNSSEMGCAFRYPRLF